MNRPAFFLLLTILSLAARSNAHDGGYSLLRMVDAGTGIGAPANPLPVVLTDGFADSDQIGYGFGALPSSPPAGTRLGIETRGGLLYWDGTDLAPTDATLTIEAPDFDHFRNPNDTEVAEYTVQAGSSPLGGMTWSTHNGDAFWHATGTYTVAGETGLPEAGVYGVAVRFVTLPTGPQLAPSPAFLLPLVYNPSQQLAVADLLDGIDVLSALVDLPGDFDIDGDVGPNDYAVWSADYGSPASPADANFDGSVNALDYTIWRDAVASPPPASIPEPKAGLLTLSALAVASTRRGSLAFPVSHRGLLL